MIQFNEIKIQGDNKNNNHVSFISYNSTGLDTIKTSWIRDLAVLTGATFISIQEHFKKSKTVENYFSEQFPNFYSYIKPGFKKEGQTLGRPMAGIAQLSSKAFYIKKQRIETKSPRIQIQILELPDTRLMYINTYL